MKRKTFWSVFSWVERKKKINDRVQVFSPDPPKGFLLKLKRKLKEENEVI